MLGFAVRSSSLFSSFGRRVHLSNFQQQLTSRPNYSTMAVHVNVEGYDAFKKAAAEHGDKSIFALFTGSAGPNGQSWCPDCVTADPVIERNLKHIPSDCVFIRCAVGDRAFWKDQNNVFRKDPKLKLTSVPTLLKYGEPQQLKEDQCAKDNLVEMLFTEED